MGVDCNTKAALYLTVWRCGGHYSSTGAISCSGC